MASSSILPQYVAFKGDNGKYLCLRYLDGGYSYLQYSTTDIGDSTVACEIVPVTDQYVRIKQICNGKFWRRSPNWIWADSGDTSSNNRDTLFRPIEVDDTTVALVNLGNNHFCKRLTTEGKTSCLNAGIESITIEAKIKVEEPVMKREIYDVVYDFDHAKISEEREISVGKDVLSNHTDLPVSMYSEIQYEDSSTTTWKASFSLKSSVKAKANVGIPKVAEAKVELSHEMQAGLEWSKTETKRIEKKAGTRVTVPPKSKAKINLVAKQGKCDVTFTYKQADTLYNGSIVTIKGQGKFTGTNMHSTTFDIPEFEPL